MAFAFPLAPPLAAPDAITASLRLIFAGLRSMLGMWGLQAPVAVLVYNRVSAMAARLERLIVRFQAGRLWRRRPRALPAGQEPDQKPGAGRVQRRPSVQLPRRFGWLVAAGKYQAAGYGAQLQTVLNGPEMQALLDASPQARRLLRPLCRALAVALPWTVPPARPPRPPKPRPSRRRPEMPDLGRIPLPRGVLTWARKQGFGKW